MKTKLRYSLMNPPHEGVAPGYKHQSLEAKVADAIRIVTSGTPHNEDELRFLEKMLLKYRASGDNPQIVEEIEDALNSKAMRFI